MIAIDGIYTNAQYPDGDINNDYTVDILDIVIAINLILDNDYNEAADMNADGTVNIQDIIIIVNILKQCPRSKTSSSKFPNF